MSKFIKSLFASAGVHVSSQKSFLKRAKQRDSYEDLISELFARNGVDRSISKAQLEQDLVALALNGFKRGGFFVEFGATNGIDLSNSYILEKNFGWAGILAEPMPRWHAALHANRDCVIDHRCVWSKSAVELEFLDVVDGELSTIAEFSNNDMHAKTRKNSTSIKVNTVSLLDLLSQYNAPPVIDYLSVDTEGSEFEILNAFDFSRHSFNFVSVEHNFSPMREKIRLLMKDNGYRMISEYLSAFDDWFVPVR